MADPLVDLVSEAEARAHLAGMGLAAPTNLLDLITGVSAILQSYANRNFVSQSYSVALDGPGGGRLSLPNFPITAVSALTVDGVAWSPATSPTARGYVFSETQVGMRGGLFCRGMQNVSITYTAGFAQIPADVRLACCEGLAAVIAQFQYNDPRVVEAKSGGTSIRLAQAELRKYCLTPGVTAVLDELKRVHPC